MLVITKNSIYYVDPVNKTISGGKIEGKCSYDSISAAMVGGKFKAKLSDGRSLQTSTIQKVRV